MPRPNKIWFRKDINADLFAFVNELKARSSHSFPGIGALAKIGGAVIWESEDLAGQLGRSQ
jgi:hypothetical protein